MTNAAVEERPLTQTEPKTAPDIDPKDAPGVTDDDGEAQTDTDAGATKAEASPPDARATRVSALADAERAEAEQRGREAALAELQQGQTQSQREQNRARLKESFPQAIRTIDTVLNRAVDEYGAPRPLTAAEAKNIKDAFEGHNRVAWESATAEVSDIVKEVAYSKLPNKAAQEEFTKLTSADTDLPAYLDAWAETAALHTKAVKALDLDTALKHSPKLRKEIEALKLTEFDAGREEGRNDPTGTSPDGGRAAVRTAPGSKTFAELEAGYGDGTNTKTEDAEYTRLRAERAKAR